MKDKSETCHLGDEKEKKYLMTDRAAFLRYQEKTFDLVSKYFVSENAVSEDVLGRLNRIVKMGLADQFNEDGLRVLDVGAGCGVLSQSILTFNPKARMTAVDLSEEMLKVLKDRLPSVSVVHSDILEFSPPFHFDSVWFNACFGNLFNPAAVLKHVSSKMSFGARLHISHPMGREFQISLHKKCPELIPHCLPATIDDAKKLAEGTGLCVEEFVVEEKLYMLSYRFK